MTVRTDRPHAVKLTYPENPDKRGLARKYWKDRSYSFGRHNTAESWVVFSAWREHLIETGEALLTSEVQAKLKDRGVEVYSPQEERNRQWRHTWIAVAASLAVCLVSNVIVWNVSTAINAPADELITSLTDEEKAIVYGYRQQLSRVKRLEAGMSVEERIAQRTAALVEGSRDDKDVVEGGS